jgi:hypothetical protein
LNEDPAPVEYQASFQSKNTVSKVAEDAWKKGERLGEVTGVPTRDHWKVSLVLFSLSVELLHFFFFLKEEERNTNKHIIYVLSGGVTT